MKTIQIQDKSGKKNHRNANRISRIMSDQSNNSPAMSAGENERGNDSQDNTSQNKGNAINENGKYNKLGQNFR